MMQAMRETGKRFDRPVNNTILMEKRSLLQGETGREYVIKEINTSDEDMNAFLFRLGCYSGEKITMVSKHRKSCVIVVKDGRYNIDNLLAEAIMI